MFWAQDSCQPRAHRGLGFHSRLCITVIASSLDCLFYGIHATTWPWASSTAAVCRSGFMFLASENTHKNRMGIWAGHRKMRKRHQEREWLWWSSQACLGSDSWSFEPWKSNTWWICECHIQLPRSSNIQSTQFKSGSLGSLLLFHCSDSNVPHHVCVGVALASTLNWLPVCESMFHMTCYENKKALFDNSKAEPPIPKRLKQSNWEPNCPLTVERTHGLRLPGLAFAPKKTFPHFKGVVMWNRRTAFHKQLDKTYICTTPVLDKRRCW